MKKFFSLFAAVLFAGSMMAADVTLNYAGKGYENAYSLDGVDVVESGVTFTLAKGTGSSAPAYYNTGTGARTYGGNTLTIDAGSSTITKIVFDFSQNNKDYTVSAGTYTKASSEWAGSATSVVFTTESGSGHNRIKSITVTLSEGGDPTPVVEYYVVGTMNNWTPAAAYKLAANPGQAGEYMGEFTFAANDEIKVRRTTDGEADAWFPEGMGNNYVINEAGDYTVYFRPEGNTEWGNGFFDAVKKEPAQPITCAEVYNLAKNDNVELLNDVVVTFANGKNVWVKDETASMLIYFSANTTYAAGDVLSGIAGVVDVYNGIHEVKPSADQAAAIVATAGEAPAAEAVTAVVAADVNKYIVMKGVEAEGTFAEGAQSNITINNVTVRNQFKNGYVFEAGNHYDVYGVVTLYQSNPQVYFITAVEVDPTAIDNTNIDAKAVKFFENGQLIIIKNGVRYNAQGAVVR